MWHVCALSAQDDDIYNSSRVYHISTKNKCNVKMCPKMEIHSRRIMSCNFYAFALCARPPNISVLVVLPAHMKCSTPQRNGREREIVRAHRMTLQFSVWCDRNYNMLHII